MTTCSFTVYLKFTPFLFQTRIARHTAPMASYLETGVCDGCGRSGLTFTGFQQHLQLSRDPLCQAMFTVRTTATPATPQMDTPSSAGASQAGSIAVPDFDDGDSTPVSFTGDAFGSVDDYADDDFGQDDVQNGVQTLEIASDGDESDDEWAAAMELQDSWERPVSPSNGDEPNQEETPLEDEPGDSDEPHAAEQAFNSDPYFPHPMSSEDRREAELRAGTRDPIIHRYSDIYPDSKPGRVDSRNTAAGVSADAKSAAGNPYAPFTSKIDWEIARWAKLRGLGSTAFSELLAIDGVRLQPSTMLLEQC